MIFVVAKSSGGTTTSGADRFRTAVSIITLYVAESNRDFQLCVVPHLWAAPR